MRKELVAFTIFFLATAVSNVSAQDLEHISILDPGQTFTNDSDSTRYVLDEEAFGRLQEQLEVRRLDEQRLSVLRELVNLGGERAALTDSSIQILQADRDLFYGRALEADKQLEACRIERTKWYNSRLLWFVFGVGTTAIVANID